MAAKSFNNIILGQFVLTGIPVKVYTSGRFLTITDADDVEDPLVGFGMDEKGDMIQFSYPEVEFVSVQGNKVDIDTYNTGMEKIHSKDQAPADKEPEPEADKKDEEEPKSDDFGPKEGKQMKLKNLIKESAYLGELPSSRLKKMKWNPLSEISAEEVDAEMAAAEAEIDAAKEKAKAAKAAEKDTIKSAKDKIKAAKANLKVATEDVVKEDREADSMIHSILSVAGSADGEGMAELAGALGVNADFYDLEDDGDLDELYSDIETSLNQVSTSEISKVYNELQGMGLVESHEGGYTFGTGDIVNDKDPGCPHFGSKGIVIELPSDGEVRYSVTNGDSATAFKPGDILTKREDQLEKI
jgi:hypothetical protein